MTAGQGNAIGAALLGDEQKLQLIQQGGELLRNSADVLDAGARIASPFVDGAEGVKEGNLLKVGMAVVSVGIGPDDFIRGGVQAVKLAEKSASAAKATATAAEDVTYLYQKVGAQGEHLKFGITKNPAIRYTQEELAGGRLKILTEGARKDMLKLERNLHETLPIGPEEAQKFYIQKQIEKGLTPPPYSP